MNFDFLAISWWQSFPNVNNQLWNFPCEISLPDLKFLIFFSRVFCEVIGGELADLEAGFKLNSRSICTNSTWRTVFQQRLQTNVYLLGDFLTIWWGPYAAFITYLVVSCILVREGEELKKKELRCLLSSEFLSQLTNWWNCFIALEYKYYYEEDPKKVHSVLVS